MFVCCYVLFKNALRKKNWFEQPAAPLWLFRQQTSTTRTGVPRSWTPYHSCGARAARTIQLQAGNQGNEIRLTNDGLAGRSLPADTRLPCSRTRHRLPRTPSAASRGIVRRRPATGWLNRHDMPPTTGRHGPTVPAVRTPYRRRWEDESDVRHTSWGTHGRYLIIGQLWSPNRPTIAAAAGAPGESDTTAAASSPTAAELLSPDIPGSRFWAVNTRRFACFNQLCLSRVA